MGFNNKREVFADYLSWCYRYRKENRNRVLKMVRQLTLIFESGI